MNYLMALLIFMLLCGLSFFTGYMTGWEFTRTPTVGLWVAITIVFAGYFASAPIIFNMFPKDKK